MHSSAINANNPYLQGKYAPIQQQSCFDKLHIIGEIPKDLNGIFARNGPNPRFPPTGHHHWFDGDGMIHSMSFADGQACYRNRWVHTAGFTQETEAGRSLYAGVMEPDFRNPLGPIKDSANTDVMYHNGKLLALWYRAGQPLPINPQTLATEKADNWLNTPKPITAHGKRDAETGELMVFHYGHRTPYIYYGAFSADGQLQTWQPIELPGERYPHDMAITRNYSILMDMPIIANQSALKSGKLSLEFRRDIPARFAIIPRHGSAADIQWFEAEPCFIYHSINAWEDGDEIIMEGCRSDDPLHRGHDNDDAITRMVKSLQLRAYYYRWRFNLKDGSVKEEKLDDRNVEFPSMNAEHQGRPTRYSYLCEIPNTDTLEFTGIRKYDNQTDSSQQHYWGDGCYGSEAPFASRNNGTQMTAQAEDDGYLLSFVYDQANDQSECRILDAQQLNAEPIARILIPQRIPLGYHACWMPATEL